jgi:hypothetical protein
MPDDKSAVPIVSTRRSKTDVFLEFSKTFAWPSITLFVIIIFWTPLQRIAEMAPNLLENSESIKIGSLSLDVGKKIGRQLPDEVRTVLQNLDSDDIHYILAADSGGYDKFFYGQEVTEEWARNRKFVELGLGSKLSKQELRAQFEEDRKNDKEAVLATEGFRTTKLFDRTNSFLINLLPEVISELRLDETSPKTKPKPK